MNYKYIILLIIFTYTNSNSADLILNSIDGSNFEFELSSTPSVINCSGLITNINDESINDINFSTPTLLCPGLSIDGYKYKGQLSISIYHQSRLVIVNGIQINNCLNSLGNPPTIGFGFILSIGGTTTGIQHIKLNNYTQVLEINTSDGDVICDGAIVYNPDVLFKNSFEHVL